MGYWLQDDGVTLKKEIGFLNFYTDSNKRCTRIRVIFSVDRQCRWKIYIHRKIFRFYILGQKRKKNDALTQIPQYTVEDGSGHFKVAMEEYIYTTSENAETISIRDSVT